MFLKIINELRKVEDTTEPFRTSLVTGFGEQWLSTIPEIYQLENKLEMSPEKDRV